MSTEPYWAWARHQPRATDRPPVCEARARALAAEWSDPAPKRRTGRRVIALPPPLEVDWTVMYKRRIDALAESWRLRKELWLELDRAGVAS